MTNLTVSKVTECFNVVDGEQVPNGNHCIVLQEHKTCVLGSQKVKDSMTYLFFTPSTTAVVGDKFDLDLSEQGPFKLELKEDVLEDGTPVKHTKLWLK